MSESTYSYVRWTFPHGLWHIKKKAPGVHYAIGKFRPTQDIKILTP